MVKSATTRVRALGRGGRSVRRALETSLAVVVTLALATVVALAGAADAAAQGAIGRDDIRRAVEAFVARAAGTALTDLTVDASITLFDPRGRAEPTRGEQRVSLKVPARQRVEQVIEGRREIRLIVGDRVWVRQPDGKTYDLPAGDGDRAYLVAGFHRTANDLLAEWRALGVRDDVGYAAQVHGRAVTVIGARPGERDTPAVWLDPDYGVVRFVRRDRVGQARGVIDATLSEHRPLVDGFFFPYRQEIFVDGKLAVLVTVRSVAVNRDLPDSLFDPQSLRAAH